MKEKFHRLICRQLRRSGLPTPDNLTPEWQLFLSKISSTYKELDESRELINRSMEISSREMRDLHSKLESHKDSLRKEVEARTRELVQANKLFRTLSESAPIGIFRANAEGSLVYVNPMFQKIFEREKEDLLDHAWKNYLCSDDAIMLCNSGILSKEQNSFDTSEYRILTPRKRVKCLLFDSTLIIENREIIGYVGTAQDITNQKSYENELVIAKNAAESATKAKSIFLANMSHELRTPLHAILSFASFGMDRTRAKKSEKLNRYFTRISQSGETLLSLLNDLLDLAKLEAGKMNFAFRKESMDRLIKTTIGEFDSLALENQLKFQYTSPQFANDVFMDPLRITQVLRNLISNAIKFSKNKGVIRIDLKQAHGRIIVSVEDQGIGIPEQEILTIFEKFIQSSKTSNGTGGTGLGLAISKEIIEAHDGVIWAKNNQKGPGVCFKFRLPMQLREKSRSPSDKITQTEK